MLPYSLCRPICRFRALARPRRRLQSRTQYSRVNRLDMKMHAKADIASETQPAWPEDIFSILQRFDVRQVPYVPDAGHSQLIERVLSASSMRAVPLTTEEEGVALLAGGVVWGRQ